MIQFAIITMKPETPTSGSASITRAKKLFITSLFGYTGCDANTRFFPFFTHCYDNWYLLYIYNSFFRYWLISPNSLFLMTKYDETLTRNDETQILPAGWSGQ